MDYVTQYYKNLSEQLQQRVNFLNKKVKYLTEAEAPAEPTPGPTDGGKGGQSPFTPGGYFYPSQLNPPLKPKPYRGQEPVKPGHYSPEPPPRSWQWLIDNPPPNPDNYPGGVNDPQFEKDAEEWIRLRFQWIEEWKQWYRERYGRPRLPLSVPDVPANWPVKFWRKVWGGQ